MFLLCLLPGLGAVGAPVSALEVRLSHVERSDVPGTLVAIENGGETIRFRPEGGQIQRLSIDEVVRIVFPATRSPSAEDAVAVLAGGDLLAGEIVGGGQEQIRLRSRTLGEFVVNLERLRGVVLPAAPPELRDRLLAGLAARAAPRDRVIFPNGDRVEGVILKVAAEAVTLEGPAGARPFLYKEIAAFAISELQAYQPDETGVTAVLETVDGCRLSGRLTGLSASGVRFRTRLARTIEVPPSQIVDISIRGGRVVYLSELRPVRVKQTPLIAGEPVLWSLQRDRNVLGQPLRLGGKVYPHGLGMHSRCEATYAIDGRYARLLGEIGIDEGIAPAGKKPTAPGGVVFRVRVDGKVVFDSGPIERGAAPRPLRADLTGGRELVLEVDFGPDGDDRGDHADWVDIRLVR